MSCFPDKERKDTKANNPQVLRALFVIGSILFVSVLMIGGASAVAVNWTNITDLIDGVAGIMPSIANLITEVITPMILLVIVGFLIGLFDSLLNGISNALNFGRR